jgi:hypothetical protein
MRAWIILAVLAISAPAAGARAGDAANPGAARAASGAQDASARPDADWVGGDPARLKADKSACREEAANVDVNAISGYTDPRYGMTSALAAAIAQDDPLVDTSKQARAANFAACMTDKGWHEP